jgi:plastocyanin
MGFKRYLACCGCLLLLVALAGCGAGGGQAAGGNQAGKASATNGGSAGAARPVVKTIAVKETEYKLNPGKITLNKPGAYVFKAENTGSTTHALEIEGKGVEEKTKDLAAGQSAELKVTLKPGRYEIYCPVDGHRQQGMEGTVTVKQGSSSGGGSGGY